MDIDWVFISREAFKLLAGLVSSFVLLYVGIVLRRRLGKGYGTRDYHEKKHTLTRQLLLERDEHAARKLQAQIDALVPPPASIGALPNWIAVVALTLVIYLALSWLLN